jgi:hypothetical protein
MPYARAEMAMDAQANAGAYSAGTTEVRAFVVATFSLED